MKRKMTREVDEVIDGVCQEVERLNLKEQVECWSGCIRAIDAANKSLEEIDTMIFAGEVGTDSTLLLQLRTAANHLNYIVESAKNAATGN